MRRSPASILGVFLLAVSLDASAGSPTGFDPAPYLGTRWYGVYLFGDKVGYGASRLEETEYRGKPAYRSEFRVDYRLNLGGSRQQMTIREEKFYLPGTGLAAFTTVQDSPLGRTAHNGRKEGDRFRVETRTGERTAEAAGETLAGSLAHLELVRNDPDPGAAATVRQFETTLLQPVTVIHTVEGIEERYAGGVPLKIYRIRSEFPELGIATSSLVDEDLRTLEGSLGIITIREEEEEIARDLDEPGDLLLSAAVRPDRRLPRPRRIHSLRLRLRGLSDPALVLASPRQEFEKIGPDTYYLRISAPATAAKPSPELPVTGEGFQSELAAGPYIQSDHPAILRRAREIVGAENDAGKAAELLTDWVFRNLEKEFLAAIPNAVDVLERRRGDCKAHSVLLVALARSIGLPARIVSGLVAMEDGLFYYHQWAELFTGEWTPADPVFGQVPVDATHIAFSRAGPARQLILLNLIGQIGIEVLEWDTGEGEEEGGKESKR